MCCGSAHRRSHGITARVYPEAEIHHTPNPARSTGVAVFGPAIATGQLWLFWVAPIVGALLGAVIYKCWLTQRGND